jgi:ABC-type cobalamin/Fe3+-siderophores transport system ATPase subunit
MSQFTCFTSTKVQILTLRSCFLQALLSLACLYLQRPSILIFDEPTNHVNFRHLPAVAAAIKSFQGAVSLTWAKHWMDQRKRSSMTEEVEAREVDAVVARRMVLETETARGE